MQHHRPHPSAQHEVDALAREVLGIMACPEYTLLWAMGTSRPVPPALGEGPHLTFWDEIILQYILRSLDKWVLCTRYEIQQSLPPLSGLLDRAAAVVCVCISEIDIESIFGEPTPMAEAAQVFIVDVDMEWAVRLAYMRHCTGSA